MKQPTSLTYYLSLNRGFALPMAIFLLVVLAGLGAYAVRLNLNANAGSALDVMGIRAYYAARAGAEWATYQVYSPGSIVAQNCPADGSVTIDGYSVALTCRRQSYTEQDQDQTVDVYEITARASMGNIGDVDYVEREINITVGRCLYAVGGLECN